MSDTPETDAHEDDFKGFLSGRYSNEPLDWPLFARSLERRLREAQEANAGYADLVKRAFAQRDAALREVEDTRRAVLEEAAKVCEARITLADGTIETRHPVELETWKCAQAIRALAEKGKP